MKCRYCSRALLIPFELPCVGPKSEEESIAFSKLAEVQDGAVGWAIKIGKKVMDEEIAEITTRILPAIRKLLTNVDQKIINFTI